MGNQQIEGKGRERAGRESLEASCGQVTSENAEKEMHTTWDELQWESTPNGKDCRRILADKLDKASDHAGALRF